MIAEVEMDSPSRARQVDRVDFAERGGVFEQLDVAARLELVAIVTAPATQPVMTSGNAAMVANQFVVAVSARQVVRAGASIQLDRNRHRAGVDCVVPLEREEDQTVGSRG